jgi:hypothetical protein
MAPPARKTLLCSSPFSSATTPLATTIPSAVITFPDMNVCPQAFDSTNNDIQANTKKISVPEILFFDLFLIILSSYPL